MSAVLADTHAILWYLFDPPRLSAPATAALSGAVAAGAVIYLSTISVIEVRYLVEKGKLPPTALTDLLAALDDPTVPVEPLAVDLNVARALEHIPRNLVPDLPDRILAATARAHGLPLVTADHKLQAAPIVAIW